ncbi:MAG: hypothetical protein EAX95_07185 [Candidatus Thorarchaeota archaeon]|nr:hypothetical protein [Candidatus Thorarchaeota archaeon]
MTSIWLRRIVYLAGAVLSIFAMTVCLEMISLMMDANWHYAYFVLNQYTGPFVIASFVIMLFFIGVSMFFMYRAFTTFELEEIPL